MKEVWTKVETKAKELWGKVKARFWDGKSLVQKATLAGLVGMLIVIIVF